jgi:hypothetical protein
MMKTRAKDGKVDSLGPQAWWSARAQSHGPAPEACASCRHSKKRQAAVKTSWVDFIKWVISWTGNSPRSARALEIPTTNCDSCPASAAHSPPIASTCARIPSNSANKSYPSWGCRPHACSYASIASHPSRSFSYWHQRI